MENQFLNSFINHFKVTQIEEVRNDWDLIKQHDFKFYYAVDTHDIVNYFLPYTQPNYINEENKVSISQKTIAYDLFFKADSRMKDIILFNEYKFELLSIKNSIAQKINKFSSVSEDLSIFFKDVYSIYEKDKQEKVTKRLNENFELILGFLILIKSKDDIYNEFIDFLNKKFLSTTFNTGDIEFDNKFNDIFVNTGISEYSKEIYIEFIDKVKVRINSLATDKSKFLYLENAFRDILVIDRLIKINSQLLKDFVDTNKTIIIYLSSAKFKSETIFNLNSVKNCLPKFPDNIKQLNFHRNIYQIFLLNILLKKGFDKQAVDKIIDSLNDWLSIINQDKILKKKTTKTHTLPDDFSELLTFYSNSMENKFYSDIYISEKNRLEKAINSIKTSDKKPAQEIIQYIDEYLKIGKQEIQKLPNDVLKYQQTFYLSQKFFTLKNKTEFLVISSGKDIIKNTFHHLPLLPFKSIDNIQKDNLYKILNLISEQPLELPLNSKEIVKAIEEIVKNLNKHNMRNDFLIISYLCLLVVSDRDNNNSIWDENISEVEIIHYLEQYKLHTQGIYINFDFTEIDYILSWLYRRDNNFEECRKITSKYLEKQDGRFFHSIGISNISHYYSDYFKSFVLGSEELLFESLNYLKSAISYYEVINAEDKIVERLIQKNIIAIYNSMADVNLRIFEIKSSFSIYLPFEIENILNANFDTKYLLEAREIIQKIKKMTLSLGLDYNSFPTYNHTEAELELLESIIFYNQALNNEFATYYNKINTLEKSFSKIVKSQERVDNFKKSRNALSPTFFNIIKNINWLRYKLMVELRYI